MATAMNPQSDVRLSPPPGSKPAPFAETRGGYWDTEFNWWVPYHVGKLKSFSSQSGYGFVDCATTHGIYKSDVYIHRSCMRTPWRIGQPLEFAVTLNSRGQPQAADVLWLPYEPEEPKDARLGILKSFSLVQGFGFITGEDIMNEFSRDVYLDRAQLASEWRMGQIVEFQTTLNGRGHPQARNLNWDPVPMLPGGKLRSVDSTGLRSLNRILVSLRSDVETALRLSMELSGKAESIDFLSFTLDRVKPTVLASLEVRVSLLLLLRISTILKDHARLLTDGRRRQMLQWCEALEPSFTQSSDSLGDNFKLTSTQVRTNLKEAHESCADLEDVTFLESLQKLRESFEN